MSKWYMTPEVVRLLAYIRDVEAGARGYNADYRNDDRWTLTDKSVDQVLALALKQTREQGERSSAIGGYQFLSGTLATLIEDLGLSGSETFNAALQDDLAFHLLYIKRGLRDAWAGKISAEQLANRIAMEWASMPIVTPLTVTRGGRTYRLEPGQSYYDGYAGNRALKDWREYLELVKAVVANPPSRARPKAPTEPAQPPPNPPDGPGPETRDPQSKPPQGGFFMRYGWIAVAIIAAAMIAAALLS